MLQVYVSPEVVVVVVSLAAVNIHASYSVGHFMSVTGGLAEEALPLFDIKTPKSHPRLAEYRQKHCRPATSPKPGR